MSTLSLIVEGNACSWGEMQARCGDKDLLHAIRSIVSFANVFLSMSSSNKLLLFMYSNGKTEKLIFNSRKDAGNDSSAAMVQKIREYLCTDASSENASMTSCLAAVLSHALCHMKRDEETVSKDNSGSSDPFSNGRVVIVSIKPEFGKEHSLLMNLFFAAAKNNICVDVLTFEASSPLLQQAADITNGVYVAVDEARSLLRLLMTHVLDGPSSRSLFPQPSQQKVDYRASCACHHKLVSNGWVCSVCLSVLCVFTPICKACGSVFKVSRLPMKVTKRKRQE